ESVTHVSGMNCHPSLGKGNVHPNLVNGTDQIAMKGEAALNLLLALPGYPRQRSASIRRANAGEFWRQLG
ncbi:hypothetical protein, partial [Mesorhizobium sp.]|uniref:hypothetical protein n=1 Tax=Mesorhizobium sp. TaxID=1871066 RepID=UPI0025811EDA